VYGSREDHIVPWKAAFASLNILNPEHKERNMFVLGASGHIAGVINPPAKKNAAIGLIRLHLRALMLGFPAQLNIKVAGGRYGQNFWQNMAGKW
jgi:hypothetical protein